MDLLKHYGIRNSGKVVVLGSGATARSAIYACLLMKIPCIVCARNNKDTAEIGKLFKVDSIEATNIRKISPSIIVNTASYSSDSSFIDKISLSKKTILIESVYYPVITPLIERARAAGADYVLGTTLYEYQAVRQSEHFFGAKYSQNFKGICMNVIRYYVERCKKTKKDFLGHQDLEELLYERLPRSLR